MPDRLEASDRDPELSAVLHILDRRLEAESGDAEEFRGATDRGFLYPAGNVAAEDLPAWGRVAVGAQRIDRLGGFERLLADFKQQACALGSERHQIGPGRSRDKRVAVTQSAEATACLARGQLRQPALALRVIATVKQETSGTSAREQRGPA